MKTLLCALILCLPSMAIAADITAVSCSQPDVKTAIQSAVNGDRVLIPAGTCTWTAIINGEQTGEPLFQKYLTIQGAGIDQTTILDGVSKAPYPNIPNVIRWVLNPNGLSRITGITWKGLGTPCTGGTLPMLQIQGDSAQFRMDHVKVVPNGCPGVSFYGNVRGVVDHSIFDVSAKASYAFYIHHGSWGNVGSFGDNSWAQPDTVGTSQAIFFEDNTFINDQSVGYQYYCIDGWNGMRIVVRHNTFKACNVGNHGTETAGRSRGSRQFEVYNNTWTTWDMKGNAYPSLIGSRGGVSVVFNNVVTTINGTLNNIFDIANQRDSRVSDPWGLCDSTSPWDQNTSGQTGYRCIDQAGASYGDYISGATALNTVTGTASWPRQGSQPNYDWNNTLNGVVNDAVPTSTHIQVGRDLIHGPRPGYTPYTYPHPLTGVSTAPTTPTAPTGLTISNL